MYQKLAFGYKVSRAGRPFVGRVNGGGTSELVGTTRGRVGRWPFSHLPVLRGTRTSVCIGGAPWYWMRWARGTIEAMAFSPGRRRALFAFPDVRRSEAHHDAPSGTSMCRRMIKLSVLPISLSPTLTGASSEVIRPAARADYVKKYNAAAPMAQP